MRWLLRWMLTPFIRFAYKGKPAVDIEDFYLGQCVDDPTEVVMVVEGETFVTVLRLDCEGAMQLGKSFEKLAYYAGDSLIAPNDDE